MIVCLSSKMMDKINWNLVMCLKRNMQMKQKLLDCFLLFIYFLPNSSVCYLHNRRDLYYQNVLRKNIFYPYPSSEGPSLPT